MWTKALRAVPDVVSITSFNEWGEGTQIEPAKSFYLDRKNKAKLAGRNIRSSLTSRGQSQTRERGGRGGGQDGHTHNHNRESESESGKDELQGTELYSTPFADTVINEHTQALADGGGSGSRLAAGSAASSAKGSRGSKGRQMHNNREEEDKDKDKDKSQPAMKDIKDIKDIKERKLSVGDARFDSEEDLEAHLELDLLILGAGSPSRDDFGGQGAYDTPKKDDQEDPNLNLSGSGSGLSG